MDLEERFQQAEQARIDGDYDTATAAYKEILEQVPDHMGSLIGLGLVYGFTGEFDESIALLEKAVELEPENLLALINLGKTYVMLSMFEEGKAVFERILKLDPEHDEALKQITFLKEFGF